METVPSRQSYFHGYRRDCTAASVSLHRQDSTLLHSNNSRGQWNRGRPVSVRAISFETHVTIVWRDFFSAITHDTAEAAMEDNN